MTAPPRRLLVVTTVGATLRAFLLPYARHLRSSGWQVDAAANLEVAEPGVEEAFDHLVHLPWQRSPVALGNGRAWRALRTRLRTGAYDVVHVHTPVASFLTRSAVASLPRRDRPAVVYTAHGFHFEAGGRSPGEVAYRGAERLAGRWTDRLVVINGDDEAQARHLRLVPPDRLVHLPGIGLDLGHYTPTPALEAAAVALREELGVPTGAPLLAMIAELSPRKNPLGVLEAVARLGRPEVHLVLAGAGPLREQVEQRVDELGLGGRVHVLGLLPDVRPLVLASRAVVLCSSREGLSRAVLEALALGVPVVGSDIRGIRELVGTGGGCLVDPSDTGAIAAGLATVLDRPAPGRLPEAVRAGMARYGLDALLAEHDRLYGDVLGARIHVDH